MVPCPRCGARLVNAQSCPACHLPLAGPVAARLWEVDQSITAIDRQVTTLTAQRKDLWQQHVSLLADLGGAAPVRLPSFDGGTLPTAPTYLPPTLPPTAPTYLPPTARPSREWTPRRVQNLLLTIGAVLLVIATAIFTAVSWHRLGDGPQALILAAAAIGAATLTRFLARRALTATAEAISGICVGLLAFDADAAHKVVLPALTGRPYWAVATAVLALLLAGLARFTRVRVPAIAAAAASLLPLLVLAFGATQPTADRALLLALDALLAALALAGLHRSGAAGRTLSDVRTCWIVGGAAAWVGGFTVPVSHLLYGLGGASLNVVLGGLVASGCAAAVTAWTVGDARLPMGGLMHPVPARALLAGASALTLVCAVVLPVQAHVDVVWWAPTVITAGLLVLVAAALLPQSWAIGPQWTAVATAAVALSTEGLSVSTSLAGQGGWYAKPWQSVTATLGGSASQAVTVPQQFGGAGNIAALLVAATMAVAAGWLLRHRTIGIATAAALVALTGVVAVSELNGSYGTGLVVEAAIALAATAGAVLLRTTLARTSTVIALAAGALTLGWALARPDTTAVVGCALVVVLVAAATRAPWRAAWLAMATLAAGYAATGVAHQLGAVDRSLGVVVAAVALVIAAALTRSAPSRVIDVIDTCSGVLVFAALDLSSASTGWVSWTLLVASAWGGVVCLRADRRLAAPLATVVGLASLVVLPAAQSVATAWVIATWTALVAAALSGALLLEGTDPVHRQVARTLAAASLPLTLLTVLLAVRTDTGTTAALSVLCLLFAAAAVPAVTIAGWNRAAAGIATALLLGTAASAAHDAGLNAGAGGLVVTLTAAVTALAAGRLLSDKDALTLELVSAAGSGLALLVAKPDATAVGWILAVAGLTVLLMATTPARRNGWPGGVILLTAASWVWLRHGGISSPEPYADPVAVVALAAGYLRRRALPATKSFVAYGPGLAGLLLPSLAWALVGSGIERPLLLAALATAVIIVGAQHGLRAPLVLGSTTLVLVALRLMAPYETLVPRWLEVGTAGTLLLVLGATYEQRRRDMQVLRSRFDALL